MLLALYQPDIPQNAGTLLRMAACLDVDVHLIEPAGFTLNDKAFKRAGLDYLDRVALTRHVSFDAFLDHGPEGRLVLLSTKAEIAYTDFSYRASDILLAGRETAGVPPEVRALADCAVTIPLAQNTRSLNVAIACAMVLGEALRQTGGFAKITRGSK